MADSVTVTNLPNPGSREAVALELFKFVRHHIKDHNLEKDLALYSACLNATFRSNYSIAGLT